MPQASPLTGPTIAIARLPAGVATAFAYVPGSGETAEIMADLGLRGLRKVRLEGRLAPAGKTDWALSARLGATVVQDCVVTLEPVTTRIDADVSRRYVARPAEPPAGSETEMPEDDNVEALPEVIDLRAVLAEALALAVPDYPRAEGAELGAREVAPPGSDPLGDDGVRPFAALRALKPTGDEDPEA